MDREYWAEANALAYLRERCPDQVEYKPIYREVRRNVKDLAGKYFERFQEYRQRDLFHYQVRIKRTY